MTGDPIPLHRCGCGALGHIIDLSIVGDDTIVAEACACSACLDITMTRLDQVRPVFERMLEVGVDHAIATDAMGFLLECMDADVKVKA